MRFLLTLLLFCSAVISRAQHTTMPPPARLEAGQLKLNAAELKEAVTLLKGRVDMGNYLLREGHIPERVLTELQRDLEVATQSRPSTELQKYATYSSKFPLYQQSDKAVFSLGRSRCLDLYQEYKDKFISIEENYRIGKLPLIAKLRAEADWRKISRVGVALNSPQTSLNDTLAPLPYFLQGADSLEKLEKAELGVLIALTREEYNQARNQYGVDSPFTREAQAGLFRLEAVYNQK